MKLIFFFALLAAPSAFACGPWGCYSTACLTYGPNSTEISDLDTCGQVQLSHLDPNNITETNFELLALELSGSTTVNVTNTQPYYATDESALETLPPEESRTAYYKGIAAFRAEDYEKAIEFFKQTTNSEKDAPRAEYYIGRSYLRASQKGYDGYNAEQINNDYLVKAREAFLSFAKKHPDHEWVSSARGLARRAAFLARDLQNYSTDWGARVDEALAESPRSEETLLNLFGESSRMDVKSLAEAKHLHPVHWLIRSYYVTRQFKDGEPLAYDIAAQIKALDDDQASFKKYRDLYAWSRAVLLLKAGRAQEGYDLLQKQSVAKTNGGNLSWLVLNARLLMALGRFDEARSKLEPFLKAHPTKVTPRTANANAQDERQIASYQIGPALNDDDTGSRDVAVDARNFYSMTYVWEKKAANIATKKNLDLLTATPLQRVFVQGATPEQMVETVSNDKLEPEVRRAIEPLVMAKLIALNKWTLATEAFKHLKTSPAKKDFAALGKSVEALSANEKDAEGNARVGLFLANIEPSPMTFSTCEKQEFGKMTSPMELYLRALDGFKADEKKKNPLEATLLRGMLLCFKDHYGAPHCGELARKWDEKTSLPVSARRAWFQRLKKRFPASKEAKATDVYW